MIISPGRNYVFVHIPKTGGTSMALALEARAMADDILIGDTPKAIKRRRRVGKLNAPGRLWKHSRLRDVDGMEGMPPSPFVFTVVRNPWDRMISLYHWARMQSFDHPMVATAKALDFGGFLTDPKTVLALKNDASTAYVTDAKGRERCNLFVRLENLETDLKPLETHLGFSLDLPHANASDRPAGTAEYSPGMIDHVGQIFAADIARFGYHPPA